MLKQDIPKILKRVSAGFRGHTETPWKLVAISIKISYKTTLVYYRNDQFVIEHSVSKNYSKTFSNISVSIQ